MIKTLLIIYVGTIVYSVLGIIAGELSCEGYVKARKLERKYPYHKYELIGDIIATFLIIIIPVVNVIMALGCMFQDNNEVITGRKYKKIDE